MLITTSQEEYLERISLVSLYARVDISQVNNKVPLAPHCISLTKN